MELHSIPARLVYSDPMTEPYETAARVNELAQTLLERQGCTGDPSTYAVRLDNHVREWLNVSSGRLTSDQTSPPSPWNVSQLLMVIDAFMRDGDRWAIYPQSQKNAAIADLAVDVGLVEEAVRMILKWWTGAGFKVKP